MATVGGACLGASIDFTGVPRQDITQKPARPSATKALILLVMVSGLAAVVSTRPLEWLLGSDFPHFYCAARMLSEGRGNQLYDGGVQRQYQARYAGRVGTPYTHPPFETLIYLPVAWLPLRMAYLLWFLLNIFFLAAASRRLATHLPLPWDWRILVAASLMFVPLLLCLLQGQDSVLLLWFVVLAFTELRRGRSFVSGCWLAVGLFKFQLILPLALVLTLTRGKGAMAKGFSLVALGLAGLSAAISGWRVFISYPSFLLHLREQPFAGFAPQAMANLRGLAGFLLRHHSSRWQMLATGILSGVALVPTLGAWKRVRSVALATSPTAALADEFDSAFASTLLFALLVSFHLNPHDLSLLLLAILLLHHGFSSLPRRSWERVLTIGLLTILFLPPLHLWMLQASAYALVGIPVLALFLISLAIHRRDHVAAANLALEPTPGPGFAADSKGSIQK